MNLPAAPKPENKEPHPARLQAFILFCQGFSHGTISDLVSVHQTMLSGWKKRDGWERWRDELLATTNPVAIPTWAVYLLEQNRATQQQLESLNAKLAALTGTP